MILLVVACTAVVVVGLLPMPYAYYGLLRVVLCLTSVVGFAAARRRAEPLWSWAYGALAVLYNPLLPARLGSKTLWIGLNVISLIFVWGGRDPILRGAGDVGLRVLGAGEAPRRISHQRIPSNNSTPRVSHPVFQSSLFAASVSPCV